MPERFHRWILIALSATGLLGAVLFAVGLPGDIGLDPWPVLATAFAMAGGVALVALAWDVGRGSRMDDVARLFVEAAETDVNPQLLSAPDGSVLFVNAPFQRFCAGLGGAAGLGTLAEAIANEDARETFRRLKAQAESGTPASAELPLIAGGGRALWWHVSVRPLSDGVVLWRGRDVSARRELDSVRMREESLLADLLDNLPAGFFSVDADGRMIFVNQTLTDWLGMSHQEMREQHLSFADFVTESTPLSEDGHGQVTVRTTTGESFTARLMQSERLGPDGVTMYTRSVVLRDVGFMPTALPAEETLLLAAHRLRWLFDEAPVGIVLLDADGQVTACNRAFLSLTGGLRSEIVDHPFTDRLDQEERVEVAGQLSKLAMGIMRTVHLDVRLPTTRKREVVASLYATRTEDRHGEGTGLILHFIDTTEQKMLEAQFAQSQKMQAVGQLAGGIAHDFNNLLTAMIGFCDLLLGRHGPEDPSFADIMQIKQNATRATNLVRQLLAFSRQQKLEPVVLDVNEAVGEVSNLLVRLFEAKVDLNLDLGREVGLVRVDKGQFDQVIMNLAVNARDAMPGGGEVTIRTDSRLVEEEERHGGEVVPPGDYVLIEVSDTGTGIAKDDLGRIFEPFFSTKEVGQGTGLGLSTVYGIVHQTGGFIYVDSTPGKGTTFSICLPRFEEGADAAPTRRASPLAVEGPESDLTGAGTILLVEDEDAVRLFASRALKDKGYTVIEAEDGEAALDALNAHEGGIDLIVSDVVMPGMDGPTMVQLVRQEMPEVKVILMSGYSDEVYSGGVDADPSIRFLGKPFSLKTLASKVKEVLAEEQ